MEEKSIEKIVRERLDKMGIRISKCSKCGKEIIFLPTHKGNHMPVTMELISHFSDCPSAKHFRKTSEDKG